MRKSLVPFVAVFAMAPMLAWADLAPPPDPYAGADNVNVAGFVFTHQRLRQYGPANLPPNQRHPAGFATHVILTSCNDDHPNCALAKAKGAVGGAIVSIDGTAVTDDVGAVEQGFSAAQDGKVTLVVIPAADVTTATDTPPTVTLEVSSE